MKSRAQFEYNIGDRVAERPKLRGTFVTNFKSLEKIKQYSTQRYGTVIDIIYKINTRKQSQKFLIIQWDHLKSSTEHAAARICPVSELDRLSKHTTVPGE